MKEQLTQEENDIRDLDAVVDHLTRLRNKAEALKMVTHGFGVTRVAKSIIFFSLHPSDQEMGSSARTVAQIF
jgi:hypothetical protein